MKYNIIEIHKEKNISLQTLSEMTGLSISYLNEVENGKANPTVKTICKIAQALETQIGQIYYQRLLSIQKSNSI